MLMASNPLAVVTPEMQLQKMMEGVKINQIQATHDPLESKEFDVKSLLQLVDQILIQPSPDNNQKISCKCSGRDELSTTMRLLNTLSSYSWAAKGALTLAAFAVTYGEYMLVVKSKSSDHLAHSIARLKQLPDIREHSEKLKNFINTILKVAKLVVEFHDLRTKYTSLDQAPKSEGSKQICIAVYSIIRSVIVGTSQIIRLDHECKQPDSDTPDLKLITETVNYIYNELHKQVNLCHEHIAYQKLEQLFQMTTKIDIVEILQALIYSQDDSEPHFIDCSTKNKVGIEVVKEKHVLLLISDLEISNEELSILTRMYTKDGVLEHVVVWLPTVDSSLSPEEKENFLRLQSKMTWYSVHHIHAGVINYIKNKWNFNKKPILVALDLQGKVINHNAFHMVRIWGKDAYPFTKETEVTLWKEKKWSLKLFECIDKPYMKPYVENISEDQLICLYGGDEKWREEFITEARKVEKKAKIKFNLIYVGERYIDNQDKDRGDQVTEELGDIVKTAGEKEGGSNHRSFWILLETMWYSMMQNEPIVTKDIKEGIQTILSYGSNKKEWALISRGSTRITKVTKRETILTFIQNYVRENEEIISDQFFDAVQDHLENPVITKDPHCSHLYLPCTMDSIQKTIQCVECHRIMEKVVMYRCCPQ
ncbi:hypothetical protein NE237_020162 [Protea cynaroides]|uniref:Uncharacterized protein n=1 Tax=Protea cynaroides TaxID=273540 RepID=A0A9Q0HA14_9MAGN|nr:hypothetical protein NE237_020162 [Protea cynaroides]